MPHLSFNRPDGLTPAQWWAWEQRRQLAEQHLAGADAADSSQLRQWQRYVAGDQLLLPATALLPGTRPRQQLTQALYASPSSFYL